MQCECELRKSGEPLYPVSRRNALYPRTGFAVCGSHSRRDIMNDIARRRALHEIRGAGAKVQANTRMPTEEPFCEGGMTKMLQGDH